MALVVAALTAAATALDNGLARTPPMGWMTWERFRCTTDAPGQGNPSCADDPDNCISETLVKQHADILARPEWREAGCEDRDAAFPGCSPVARSIPPSLLSAALGSPARTFKSPPALHFEVSAQR